MLPAAGQINLGQATVGAGLGLGTPTGTGLLTGAAAGVLSQFNGFNPAMGAYNPAVARGASGSGSLGDFLSFLFPKGTGVPRQYQHYVDTIRNNPTAQNATGAFIPPKNPTNDLVGQDVGSIPNYLTQSSINQIFSGLTNEEKAGIMQQKGYTRTYQAGVGEIWVKTGEGTGTGTQATSAVSSSFDSRGRPNFVDPTSLERGQRVTSASGVTFIGGADYTDAQGNTVAQYAMTFPGVKDPKGRYKWKSRVVKDDNGNWVRQNFQVLRKVYSRSHRKKLAQRREEQRQNNQVSGQEINQLVNLRADYG